jgi:hypothetical protein
MIADRVGIEPTLIGVSLIPLFAAACALWLPGRVHAVSAPQPAEVMLPETRP